MWNVLSRYLRRFRDPFITTFVSCSQSLMRSRLNIIGGDVLLLEVGFNFSRKRAWQYLAICQVRFWISGCGLDIDWMNGLATVNYGSFNFEFHTEVQEYFRAEIPGLPRGSVLKSVRRFFEFPGPPLRFNSLFLLAHFLIFYGFTDCEIRMEISQIPRRSILNPVRKHLEFRA